MSNYRAILPVKKLGRFYSSKQRNIAKHDKIVTVWFCFKWIEYFMLEFFYNTSYEDKNVK